MSANDRSRQDVGGAIRSFERKQWIVAMLGLLILLAASIILASVHLTSAAEQSARIVTRMIVTRDLRDVAETLEAAHLEQFDIIRYVSPEPGRSFTLPPIAEIMPDRSLWRWFSHERATFFLAKFTGDGSRARVEYEFNRFRYLGYGFLFWCILLLVSVPQTRLMKRRLIAQFKRDMKLQRDVAQSEIARMVCHNLRTPLAALMRLGPMLKGLSTEERTLFNSVVGQMQGIDATLSQASKGAETVCVEVDGATIGVADTFREAVIALSITVTDRICVRSEVDDSSYSAIVNFRPGDLKDILANLVANAVDAISHVGEINLRLEDHANEVVLSVSDSGRGMATDVVARAGERGFTFDKVGGSGLGLFHAKSKVEAWGGRLAIDSQPGKGTVVSIHLPLIDREPWYVPRIKLSNLDRAVVVDDQPTARNLWAMTLKESGFIGRVQFAASAAEAAHLLACDDGNGPGRLHVFADYDLGESAPDGLAVLREASGKAIRYLVTGHFDEIAVRAACRRDGVSLLAKTALSRVPVVVR